MNTHNNCEFSEKVYEYMDGTLSAEDRARVLEHLKGCESCSELKKEHEAFAALLDSVNEELPEGLHDRIMGNVRREMRRDRFMRAIKRSRARNTARKRRHRYCEFSRNRRNVLCFGR